MEENIIVSEVSFSEKSNGAAVADGFFISSGKGNLFILLSHILFLFYNYILNFKCFYIFRII